VITSTSQLILIGFNARRPSRRAAVTGVFPSPTRISVFILFFSQSHCSSIFIACCQLHAPALSATEATVFTGVRTPNLRPAVVTVYRISDLPNNVFPEVGTGDGTRTWCRLVYSYSFSVLTGPVLYPGKVHPGRYSYRLR
ncbi:unnamed protein product, partial [Laminaria digitata]